MSSNTNNCRCGCGKQVIRTWSKGHNRKGTTFTHTQEAKEKVRQAQLAHNSMAGKIPWNKGKQMPEETRQKVKEARARQIITTEHKKAISDGLKDAYKSGKRTDIGEKKWNWKGGIRSGVARIRNSYEMKLWSRAVLGRDNFVCQECGTRGGKLHAHHIKSFSLYPELRLDLENGTTLCVDCHKETDNYLGKANRKLVKI